MLFSASSLLMLAILTAGSASIASLILKRWPTASKFFCCSLFGISGLSAVLAGVKTLITNLIYTFQFSSGFINITWSFKLDALSGFFLAIVGLIVFAIAFFAPGYLRLEKKHSIARMNFFTGFFIVGMYLVLIANDVVSFMFAWEIMSITSYFLVAHHHEHAANRSAAFVYLLMAQASGLFILLSFSVLTKFSGEFSFGTIMSNHLSSNWATIAFLLAFIGFGMKAGIVPLHVWLPKAHPVAPSHISALMSGVMLKVAIYGLLRFCFSLIKNLHWQWGVLILFIGIASALLGVLYALMQHDLKKLLAYHSVENIGIIFIGIGLAIIFVSTNHPALGALGLAAALYHSLNHAIFKSLLFLGAGAILQKSHESDLEKMGGLIHKMPHTALFFLIGCLSIAALPPFNGFVSEWLTFQTALQVPLLESGILRALIPVTAALLALTGALAAACFVKVYGIAFLGQARTRHVRHAKDPSFGMKSAMAFLAFLCLLFGVLPTLVLKTINVIPSNLIGTGLINTDKWLWLTPLSAKTSSYSASLTLLGILIIGFLSYWLLRFFYKRNRIRIAPPWDCGFGGLTPKMEYTATAFAMPIRRVFKGAWHISEKTQKTNGTITYSLKIEDWFWQYFYEPLKNLISRLARIVAYIQGGNVRIYLAYAFFTLIFLLWLVT